MSADKCRPVEVDGVSVLVRGSGELTDLDRQYLGELVDACRRAHDARTAGE